MNNKTLKKVLIHMANGRALKEIGQFVDMEWRVLRHRLIEMGVESPADARKKLKQVQAEELQLPTKVDRSADRSGEVVPEFKPEPAKHEMGFDRSKAIINEEAQKTKERIPLAEHQEFRRDLKDRPWVQILKKWGNKHRLDEDLLMEQAVLLSPQIAKSRFGFGDDDNMEDRKALR